MKYHQRGKHTFQVNLQGAPTSRYLHRDIGLYITVLVRSFTYVIFTCHTIEKFVFVCLLEIWAYRKQTYESDDDGDK